MVHVAHDDISGLRGHFHGALLSAGTRTTRRRAASGMAQSTVRPAIIARCADEADIAAALLFAREHGLQVSVRGGGHNYGGHAVCDDGLIDLSNLNEIQVDPATRRATCGGGTTWGELDAATQAHGLAVTGGFISTTGMAGLTLGGGIGWLSRQARLSATIWSPRSW